MPERNTKIVKEFVHRSGEEQSDLWEPDAEQQYMYYYALYEICIELEVDLDTGKSRIVAVDGHALATLPDFA